MSTIIYLVSLLVIFNTFSIVLGEIVYEVPPSLVKHARKLEALCQKRTSLPNELLEESRKNSFVNERSMQCFLQCMLDMAGLMNNLNVISLEGLVTLVPPSWVEMVRHVDNTCGTQAGADSCEIAYNTFLCYSKVNKEFPMIL